MNNKNKKQPNYANGKIYKIENDVNDMIYIGSTTALLSHRFSRHKDAIKTRTTLLVAKLKEIGIQHFRITLLESYPCLNKTQLEAREYEMTNALPIDKLYNTRFNGKMKHTVETKKKISESQSGVLNYRFKRGCIYVSESSNITSFTWSLHGKIHAKTFRFCRKRTKQQAYMLCIDYQNMIYPLTNQEYLFELPFAIEEIL